MDSATSQITGGFQSNKLVQAWLVLVLAVVFGISLAGVQLVLGPIIEKNKMNETLEKVPELVLGKDLAAKMAGENQVLEITPNHVMVENAGRSKFYSVYEASYQGDRKGWVVKNKGRGYADTIELLVGFSPDFSSITGLFVLDQKETPGLGNKIIFEKWRNQFINAPTDKPLVVVKTGSTRPEEIDAVTGATISSKSVTVLINSVISDLKEPLTAAPNEAGKEDKDNG